MKRREFLAASGAAGLGSFALQDPAAGEKKAVRQLLEWRTYHLELGNKKKLMHDFFKDAVIPASTRLGAGPIGVFEPLHGADSLTLYMLVSYKSFESFLTAPSRRFSDPEFQKASEALYQAPLSDPPYRRVESSLMFAFEKAPSVELPPLSAEKKPRIFELRVYESHHGKAAQRKVEMFNAGGEIAIFRKTGLQPIFFGETIAGARMPNLTYMLVFADYAAREKTWDTFRNDPDWKKLSADPYYADTVSNITSLILRPTPYSQI
jgi:hypothetical protein